MTELQVVELDALIRLYNTLRAETPRSAVGYSSLTLANSAITKSSLELREETLLDTILTKMEALVLTDCEVIDDEVDDALLDKEDMMLLLQLDPNARAINIKWDEDQFIFYKYNRFFTEQLEEFNDLDDHYPNEKEWLIFS